MIYMEFIFLLACFGMLFQEPANNWSDVPMSTSLTVVCDLEPAASQFHGIFSLELEGKWLKKPNTSLHSKCCDM